MERALRAMRNQVLARKLKDNHKDQGGIKIPESEWARIKRGVVVSSGHDPIVPGEIIVLPNDTGDEFFWNDDIIIRAHGSSVLGVVIDDDTTLIDGEKFVDGFVPLNDNIVIRACRRVDYDKNGKPVITMAGGMAMEAPAPYVRSPEFVEVINPSNDVNVGFVAGMTVWLNREFSKDLWCLDYRHWDYWVASESLIPGLYWESDVPIPMVDYVVAKMNPVEAEKGLALDDDTKQYNREWSNEGVLLATGPESCVKKYVGHRVKMARDCYHFENEDGTIYAAGRDNKIEGIYV